MEKIPRKNFRGHRMCKKSTPGQKPTFRFAAAEDGEEKRQTDVDEVGRVLLRPLAAEVLQQLVDHGDHLE
jgi:hypothetical protein